MTCRCHARWKRLLERTWPTHHPTKHTHEHTISPWASSVCMNKCVGSFFFFNVCGCARACVCVPRHRKGREHCWHSQNHRELLTAAVIWFPRYWGSVVQLQQVPRPSLGHRGCVDRCDSTPFFSRFYSPEGSVLFLLSSSRQCCLLPFFRVFFSAAYFCSLSIARMSYASVALLHLYDGEVARARGRGL